jgi:hypothetical protein
VELTYTGMTSTKLHFIFPVPLFISTLQPAVTITVPECCDNLKAQSKGSFISLILSIGFECFPVP